MVWFLYGYQSPEFTSPNLLNFLGKAYDERVDIFSFGIIVCEVITTAVFSIQLAL